MGVSLGVALAEETGSFRITENVCTCAVVTDIGLVCAMIETAWSTEMVEVYHEQSSEHDKASVKALRHL